MDSRNMFEGFTRELEKIAVDQEGTPTPAPDASAPSWKDRLKAMSPTAGGALAGTALAAGGLIAARPALRRHFMADLKALGTKGGAHAVDRAKPIPEAAVANARAVAEHLRAQGFDPKKHRIAISATGGTGKSTLAKALSQELGMETLHLDDVGKSMSGRDLSKWIRDNPNSLKPGQIAEQTHSMNQVDPEHFDALIHLEKPMEHVKEQILNRGRGAMQLEDYNYDKLHKAIRTAFDSTDGEAKSIAEGIRVKLKPEGGFKAQEMLHKALTEKGIDPSKLSREQQVLSASTGERHTSKGVVPYLRKSRLAAGAGILGTGGVAGGLGARALASSQQGTPTDDPVVPV